MADADTIRVYDEGAEAYADRFDGTGERGAVFAGFVGALPPGGRVLDLGCGTGATARALTDAGFTVDAVDGSEGMARVARDRFGIDVRVMDFADLDAEAVYDGVVAAFSLLHAPKAEMPDHLSRIARALKPRGRLFLGLKTGEGEARDRMGRFYAYWGTDELRDRLSDAGFAVMASHEGESTGFDGTRSPWILIDAERTT